MPDAIWDYLSDVGSVLFTMPLKAGEKFYFLYLLTFVGLAYLSFRLHYRKRTSKPFFRFLFPKSIYLHESAKVDYGVFLINVLISPFLLVGAGLQAWLSIEVGGALIDLFGEPVFRGEWSTQTYLFFILGFTLAADLSVYLIHRFHHASEIFWPLHALHHSAEVLTPVTLFRKHPLWNVLANLMSLTFTGLFQGLFVFVFFGGPGVEVLFGINTIYLLYNFFGANLRHSHVWLSWGRPLSHLFISPAMHQIHHDPKRMNRNYGEVFAIWDWLFGTLYVPERFEEFPIGLGDEEVNPHDSIAKAFYLPVLEMARVLKRKIVRQRLT